MCEKRTLYLQIVTLHLSDKWAKERRVLWSASIWHSPKIETYYLWAATRNNSTYSMQIIAMLGQSPADAYGQISCFEFIWAVFCCNY